LLLVLAVAAFGCSDDDPAAPPAGDGNTAKARVVGSIDVLGEATGIHTTPTHAFVSAGSRGLLTIEIDDKTAPVRNGGTQATAPWGRIAGTSSFLYLGSRDADVAHFNLADPTAPTHISGYRIPGSVSDLAFTPDLSVLCSAYGADGVYFILGPSSVSSFATTDFPVCGVAATNTHCFAIGGPGGSTPPGVVAIDIRNPTAPTLAGSLSFGGSPFLIVIKGNYAYISNSTPAMYVVNISDPANPSLVGQTGDFPATGPIAVDPIRDLVYMGTTETSGQFASGEGLKVIDVSDPTSPTIVETLDLPDWTTGLMYRADYLYATTDDIRGGTGTSKFMIIDVSRF